MVQPNPPPPRLPYLNRKRMGQYFFLLMPSHRNFLEQAKNSTRTREKRALVVDGKTLVYVLDKRANIQDLFLQLTEQCCAVLGVRATPLQKAYIVR